jgi:hypothetical protein
MKHLPIIAAALLAPLPALAHPGHGGPEEILTAVLLIALGAVAFFVVPKALRRRKDQD